MDRNIICEALYALPEGRVVARRKSIVSPLFTAIVGIVLLVINFTLIDDSAGALAMTLMVAGITMIAYGLIVSIARACSSASIPYDTKSKRYMKYRERYFERTMLNPLRKAIANGDNEALETMPTTNVSAITLAEYYTPDGKLAAYAIYEYADMDVQRIVGDVHIVAK